MTSRWSLLLLPPNVDPADHAMVTYSVSSALICRSRRAFFRGEYEKYMALRTEITKGIEDSESEFMLQTYSMLHRVMKKRTKAAIALSIQLDNKEIREKRE